MSDTGGKGQVQVHDGDLGSRLGKRKEEDSGIE